MKSLRWTVIFVAGVGVGHLSFPATAAQFRATKSARLLTTDLTGWCDGKEVTVELNEAGPGTSGAHSHPAHSFTYVLEGSETYVRDGEPSRTVRSGDLLYEAPMQLHSVENTAAVKLLVIRVADKGKEPTVRVR